MLLWHTKRGHSPHGCGNVGGDSPRGEMAITVTPEGRVMVVCLINRDCKQYIRHKCYSFLFVICYFLAVALSSLDLAQMGAKDSSSLSMLVLAMWKWTAFTLATEE